MKDYTFKVPQDIVFGVGSLKRLPELLEKSGSKKMMVVSDRGLEKLGVVQKVLDIVEAEGIETVSFLDILPNLPKFRISRRRFLPFDIVSESRFPF